jgi:hypothetical protein
MPLNQEELLLQISKDVATNTTNLGHIRSTMTEVKNNQKELSECFYGQLDEVKADVKAVEKGAVFWRQVAKILGSMGVIAGIVFGAIKLAIAIGIL